MKCFCSGLRFEIYARITEESEILKRLDPEIRTEIR